MHSYVCIRERALETMKCEEQVQRHVGQWGAISMIEYFPIRHKIYRISLASMIFFFVCVCVCVLICFVLFVLTYLLSLAATETNLRLREVISSLKKELSAFANSRREKERGHVVTELPNTSVATSSEVGSHGTAQMGKENTVTAAVKCNKARATLLSQAPAHKQRKQEPHANNPPQHPAPAPARSNISTTKLTTSLTSLKLQSRTKILFRGLSPLSDVRFLRHACTTLYGKGCVCFRLLVCPRSLPCCCGKGATHVDRRETRGC